MRRNGGRKVKQPPKPSKKLVDVYKAQKKAKKMRKRLAKVVAVWYYMLAPSAETKE